MSLPSYYKSYSCSICLEDYIIPPTHDITTTTNNNDNSTAATSAAADDDSTAAANNNNNNNNNNITLPCGHSYHRKCIRKWINECPYVCMHDDFCSHDRCPTCKFVVPEEIVKKLLYTSGKHLAKKIIFGSIERLHDDQELLTFVVNIPFIESIVFEAYYETFHQLFSRSNSTLNNYGEDDDDDDDASATAGPYYYEIMYISLLQRHLNASYPDKSLLRNFIFAQFVKSMVQFHDELMLLCNEKEKEENVINNK